MVRGILSDPWVVVILVSPRLHQPGILPGRARRANVILSEVLVPRNVIIRSLNAAITSLPFVWCFVRHRAVQLVGDQSIIANRLVDPTRGNACTLAPSPAIGKMVDPIVQPPAWTLDRDTMIFQLTIPSARIPGESRFIGLASSNTVQVSVIDTVGSALPEFCLTLPSGEVLDLVQYDPIVSLPDEVPHDECAAIIAMLTIQFEEPAAVKRQRGSA